MSPGDIAAIITAVVAVVVLGGGYAQFVQRRSGLGSVEFDVEFEDHHRGRTQIIGELACVIKNVGSSLVEVTDMRCRAIYRLNGDSEDTTHTVEPTFGHRLGGEKWFFMMKSGTLIQPITFIQPGVTQYYRKPIAMPVEAQVLHVWGSFDYRIQTREITRLLIGLTAQPTTKYDWRTKGIKGHSVRRTFSLAN